MKRLALAIALVFLFSAGTMAQVTNHSVTLTWASTQIGATFNMYRAPCTGAITAGVCSQEGTFSKVSTAPITVKTYTDTTVAPGVGYSYYVTAVCINPACGASPTGAPYDGESAASGHYAAKVPLDPVPPQPPTNLTITSVAQVINGANRTLNAKWTNDPGISTSWQFWIPGGRILASGILVNPTGTYSQTSTAKVRPGTQITFTVCDTTGNCKTQPVI